MSTGEDAFAELRRLRDEGRLAADYPRVCSLVAGLDQERRVRAGQLLTALDADEVDPAEPAVTVVVTGNGTVTTLVAPLTAELARHGLLPRVHASAHGQFVVDLADPSSPVYTGSPELAVCLLDPDVVRAELAAVWTIEDCEQTLRAIAERLRGLVARHDGEGGGTLVLNTIPLPGWLAGQLIDYRSRARLGVLWREFNSSILELAAEFSRCVVVDLDVLLGEAIPLEEARLRTYAKVGFAEQLLWRYAAEIAKIARSVRGRAKKCLALDLDGTLWGGVLGDDGQRGIEIGDTGRGEAFTRFQQTIAQLGSQGVLLALCSKNDEDRVREALREHPRMVLREDDFVALAVNWDPKDGNIAGLARQLNIGVDSVVFVDDSAFECGLVRRSLPAVDVVQLDDEPARHEQRLLDGDWFAALRLTDEDYSRREKYRTEARRQNFREGFSSLSDYLAELDIRVEMFTPAPADLPRLAQMTQRTNQFNLTTRRMDLGEVTAHASGPGTEVWAVRSADRFGENGIVGAIFARTDEDVLTLENMLLSCRVFSRGIETACLRAVLAHAADRGIRGVTGLYRQTAKNSRFADFYPGHGFAPGSGDGEPRRFHHDLAELPPPVDHITMTEHLGGVPR